MKFLGKLVPLEITLVPRNHPIIYLIFKSIILVPVRWNIKIKVTTHHGIALKQWYCNQSVRFLVRENLHHWNAMNMELIGLALQRLQWLMWDAVGGTDWMRNGTYTTHWCVQGKSILHTKRIHLVARSVGCSLLLTFLFINVVVNDLFCETFIVDLFYTLADFAVLTPVLSTPHLN